MFSLQKQKQKTTASQMINYILLNFVGGHIRNVYEMHFNGYVDLFILGQVKNALCILFCMLFFLYEKLI